MIRTFCLLIFLTYSIGYNSLSLCMNHGVAAMQGRRLTMEDAHRVEFTDDHAFFGVYDGHGGRDVADYAAEHLYKNCNLQDCDDGESVRKKLKDAFLQTHADLPDEMAHEQGCTAIVALIHKARLFIANAGDSRAVLCSAEKAVPLSQDHKPDRLDEKARIEALGGFVTTLGVARVQGSLAVSRALGDKELHPYVIPDPEIEDRAITQDDNFLILACDGVWDEINNQCAVDLVKESLRTKPNDFTAAAEFLMQAAYNAGSTDNISVIVVGLQK